MSKRVITYARVSGDDRGNDGRNLTGQLAMCKDYAIKRGHTIIAELAEDDRGASGASFELEQLKHIWEMAQEGKFDVLVTREIDRLSRNLAKQLIVEETLKRYGVQIEYVLGEYPDTPEGNLQKNIKATIAEYEREKIRERMIRGKELKLRAGSVMTQGKAPYGYKVVEKDKRWELEIYPPEVEIVKMIFTWYIEGNDNGEVYGCQKIAIRLTELGIPTYADIHPKSGGVPKLHGFAFWNSASVHCILTNETYAGIWRYGKQTIKGDKWVTIPKDKLIEVTVPAIISREMWNAVQERMEYNRDHAKRNLKYSYLLRRRVYCGSCGSKMHIQTTRGLYYYHCQAKMARYARDCQNNSHYSGKALESIVWEWVIAMLTDPQQLQQGLQDYQTERDKANAPIHERLKVVEGLLDDNRAQLGRLLDVYLSGEFPKEMLTERKSRLEGTITALENERAALALHFEAQTLTPQQIQSIQEFAARITLGARQADTDFETRRKIIEALGVEVTLTREEGQKIAYVRSILGEPVFAIANMNTSTGFKVGLDLAKAFPVPAAGAA